MTTGFEGADIPGPTIFTMPRTMAAGRRTFPGWRILGLAIVTSALTGPGQTIGVSVFVDSFISDLELSRSAVATAYLIGTLSAASLLPWVGKRVDTHGVRRSMAMIGFALAVALALMSGVRGIVTLTGGFLLIRLFGQGSLSLVSTVAVTLWFEKRRGLVLGLLATGTGMLMSLIPFGSNALISAFGWRNAWLVLAGVIAVTVIPIAWFGMIDRPADRGLAPDGGAFEERTSASPASSTRPQAIRTIRFWVLMGSTASVGMLSTALNFHQISLLGEVGLSTAEAAAMFLPQFVGAAAAGLIFGWVSDRLSGRTLIPMAMSLLTGTLFMASQLTPGWRIVGYALLLGATGGASRSVGATLLPRWFGTANIGSISGFATLIGAGSTALGPVAYSLVRDATGDYGSASLLYIVIPVLVALSALAVGGRRMTTG